MSMRPRKSDSCAERSRWKENKKQPGSVFKGSEGRSCNPGNEKCGVVGFVRRPIVFVHIINGANVHICCIAPNYSTTNASKEAS